MDGCECEIHLGKEMTALHIKENLGLKQCRSIHFIAQPDLCRLNSDY
jgi:hypothetical protein